MCEANVYFYENDKEHLIMKSVNVLEPEGDHIWRLVNIFGDQKDIQGRIRNMKLVDHKIVFEAIDNDK